MKKHMLISSLTLALITGLGASQKVTGDHFFRPAFQKKLMRVSPIKNGSYRSLSFRKKVNQQEVFIDWQKLYWGKLSDLIYGTGEFSDDGFQEIAGKEAQDVACLNTEETEGVAKELRQELKAFAKQYGLKIVWRKKSSDTTDGTLAFLDYWDKGLSQKEKGKDLPFSELCAVSAQSMQPKTFKKRP